jgi:hypothetical protein
MRLYLIVVVAAILPTVAIAQEIRLIDLSSVDQPAPLRPFGSTVENLSCGGSKELFPHRAKASLVWIKSTDLHPDQRIALEIRIENVGPEPINLPINPSLAGLQPEDPHMRFEYYSLRLGLEAGVPAGGLLIGQFELYGSGKNPNTFLMLQPGQSIRVKGEVLMPRWYAMDQNVTLSAEFWLSKLVFPAEKSNTTFASDQRCILQVAGASIAAHMH